MPKIKLVMIEDNKDLCNLVLSRIQLNHENSFDIIGTAHDGKSGYELIIDKMPDVVLLDIVLPIQSGLCVLKKIKQNLLTKHIICIIISSINSNLISTEALDQGADYYIAKPFQVDDLIERVIYLYSARIEKALIFTTENNKKYPISILSVEDFAIYALQKTHIPLKLNGYMYLKSAIIMCIHNQHLLDAVTKELYAEIGLEYKTTGSRVERSIRNAIEHAWLAGFGEQYYKFIADYSENNKFEKPTNSRFIFSMVSVYLEHHKNS